MERKNLKNNRRVARKPQSWTRTRENGNSILIPPRSDRETIFAGSTLSSRSCESRARFDTVTAINIINEQSALIIFSMWLQSDPSKGGGIFGNFFFQDCPQDRLNYHLRSRWSSIKILPPQFFWFLHLDGVASRDAKSSAAINLNNFGIFLTLKKHLR